MQDPAPDIRPDPLAEALLPVLVHRMNNTTQLLSSLRTVLQAAPGRDWLGERAEDLADAHGELRVTGYLFGLLSCASGADLLGDRRESGGLRWLLRAVGEVLRREGGQLREPPSGIPDLTPASGAWALPWLVGRLLHEAGRLAARGETELEWSLGRDEDGGWSLRAAPALAPDEALGALLGSIPGATLALEAGRLHLRIPAGLLVEEA